MSRIRSIKPELPLDEDLAELSFAARYLFINLFCHADRNGRLEDRPKKIKAQILPWDDVDVDALLDELSCHFVLRYEAEGGKFIQIINFSKHQRPSLTEQAGIIPAPSEKDLCTIKNIVPRLKKSVKGMGKGMGKGYEVCAIAPQTTSISTNGTETASLEKTETTPIQKIVNAFKIAKGIDKNDTLWDKANFGRYAKAAKLMLAMGSLEHAVAYVILKANEFRDKNLDFTLETIVRHYYDQKGEINVKNEAGRDEQNEMGFNPISELGNDRRITQERENREKLGQVAGSLLRQLPRPNSR